MQATASASARARARSLWLLQGGLPASSSLSKCVTSSIQQQQHQQHKYRQQHATTAADTLHRRRLNLGATAAATARGPLTRSSSSTIFLNRHFVTSTTHPHNNQEAATLRQEATSIPPVSSGSAQAREYRAYKKQRRRYRAFYVLLGLGAAGVIGYHFVPPFRRGVIATQRITLVASAVLACIADYKILFWREWDDPAIRHRDYKRCHSVFTCPLYIMRVSPAKSRGIASSRL